MTTPSPTPVTPGVTAVNDDTTDGTVGYPSTTPVQPIITPVPAPVSPTITVTPSPALHIDPKTGKSWQQLLNEEKSRSGRLEQQLAKLSAETGAQITELANAITERDNAIAQLNQNVAQLNEQVARIPDLETENTQLKTEATLGKKYKKLVRYPRLLDVYAESQVEGQEQPQKVNPVLTLIETTTLEGDALDIALSQMSQALGTAQAVPPAATAAPAVPTPTTPIQDRGEEYWTKKLDEAQDALIADMHDKDAFRRFSEASMELAKLGVAPK